MARSLFVHQSKAKLRWHSMAKDLTESSHDRQNILNNRYALKQAEKHLDLGGVKFQGETVFTKAQVMALFEVSERTVERYLASHGDELGNNGHQVLKGKKLKEFKKLNHGTDTNDGTKTSVFNIFSFRALLNLGMLLTESGPARLLRSRLMDIVWMLWPSGQAATPNSSTSGM